MGLCLTLLSITRIKLSFMCCQTASQFHLDKKPLIYFLLKVSPIIDNRTKSASVLCF